MFAQTSINKLFDKTRRFFDLGARGRSAQKSVAVGRYRNPIMKDWTDTQPWEYYDRLTTAAGASTGTELLFYTTPLSATKSKLDTNLKQAGRLPDPKHFFVTALRFIFAPNILITDIQAMINSFYVEFEIGDKIYAEGHLDLYAGGAGVYGETTRSNEATWSNGVPDPMAINHWGTERGIHILQGQTFQVRVRGTAVIATAAGSGGTGINLRAVMDGILYREVQ